MYVVYSLPAVNTRRVQAKSSCWCHHASGCLRHRLSAARCVERAGLDWTGLDWTLELIEKRRDRQTATYRGGDCVSIEAANIPCGQMEGGEGESATLH